MKFISNFRAVYRLAKIFDNRIKIEKFNEENKNL